MNQSVRTEYRIGMVGLGLMGHGIASILNAGYSLAFLDHPGNQPVDDTWRQAPYRAQARGKWPKKPTWYCCA